jgi:hypothetical protein
MILWSGYNERRARELGIVGVPTEDSLVDAVRTALEMGVEERFRQSLEQYVSPRETSTS